MKKKLTPFELEWQWYKAGGDPTQGKALAAGLLGNPNFTTFSFDDRSQSGRHARDRTRARQWYTERERPIPEGPLERIQEQRDGRRKSPKPKNRKIPRSQIRSNRQWS